MTNFQLGSLLLTAMAFGATLYAIYQQDGWRVYATGLLLTLFCGALALPSNPINILIGIIVSIIWFTWIAYVAVGKKTAAGVGLTATALFIGAIQYTIGWF